MFDVFYLSFADEGGWKGACFVKSPSITLALMQSSIMGINPGGEAVIRQLPRLPEWIFKSFGDRLLKEDDLRSLDRALGGDGSLTTDVGMRRKKLFGEDIGACSETNS